MRILNAKKMTLWILAVILCVTTCAPAFASTGDRTVLYLKSDDESMFQAINFAYRIGDGFGIGVNGIQQKVLVYREIGGEPEEYVMERPAWNDEDAAEETDEAGALAQLIVPGAGAAGTEDMEDDDEAGSLFIDTGKSAEEDEDEEPDGLFLSTSKADKDEDEEAQEPEPDNGIYDYVECWFSWNGELYGLQSRQSYEEGRNTIKGIDIKHVKLEDGKLILEEGNLPELDPEYLIAHEGGNDYFYGMQNVFTTGDWLVMIPYTNEMTSKMILCNLKDNSVSVSDADYTREYFPGPDGMILAVHRSWSSEGNTVSVYRMNPATQEEEELLAEINGLKDYEFNPCYDAEKNILYYQESGEIWALPCAEPEKKEVVNEYSDNGNSMMLLPGGFLLLWNYRAVMIKNTDPSQRGGITLRVLDTQYTSSVNDAAFEMSNERGDLSVILAQNYSYNSDVLQAMMNHDTENDIYVLSYEGNDFKALRDRGYLMDLSDIPLIAESTERMYPAIRDAVKKDGKIIGVPVSMYIQSMGIRMDAWEKIGGTEEELPQTWDQFFDWLEKMPERLEGTQYSLVYEEMDAMNFRYQLIQQILNQYEVCMAQKGDDYLFNTPLLNGLLKRVNDLNTEALGLKEYVDMEEGRDPSEENENGENAAMPADMEEGAPADAESAEAPSEPVPAAGKEDGTAVALDPFAEDGAEGAAAGEAAGAEGEDMESSMYGDNYREPILDIYGNSGIRSFDYSLPLALGFEGENDRILPVTIGVAFMNPYTTHPEEAREFLAEILKHQDSYDQYTFFADKTEPVRSPYADEMVKSHEQYMKSLQKQLEKAEGEAKVQLEEDIRTQEKNWEEQQKYLWSISAETVAAYQKMQSAITVQGYSFFNSLYRNGDNSDNKEAMKIISGLFGYTFDEEGEQEKTTAEEALALLDKKIRMMRMEGN